MQLRQMKQHHGGELTLTEVIREPETENQDYVGPAGFKGRGKDGVETRDHTFGTFTGQMAVVKDFNPTKELDEIQRWLASAAAGSYGQDVLEFICSMSEKQRHAAVVILKTADEKLFKLRNRMKDLASFFTPENALSFNAFYTHDLNSLFYRVEYTTIRGEPTLRFRKGASFYDVTRGSWAEKLDFEWPR